jgi:hypothetical protein
LDAHEDVVRYVSWRPTKNSNYEVIASGGDVIKMLNKIFEGKKYRYLLLKIFINS